jgi:GT2 family glycosyltransferase
MAAPEATSSRVRVDGKFFRCGDRKFHPKGLTYGPFAPDASGETFASRAQTEQDFRQIRELGANLLRVYYVPPRWLLDLAHEHGLKLLVDIPWPKHICFLESYEVQEEARRAVREAVQAGRGHPAIFAYSVANEIPAEIVRWSGSRATERFIEDLVALARELDPDCLFTFASFPPTEFLQPRNLDFLCFNVYLHQRAAFETYLARLQMLADAKPLVLGEFGFDSLREGEARKCEMLAWQIEAAFRAGLAGVVCFSFTDDWHRGGRAIEDWAFGLTTRARAPKPSLGTVQRLYRTAPYFPPARTPRVSVVVASYNGGRTLRACLESLGRLNYPDYEVILVDDGSTDDTAAIAGSFAGVRYLAQANRGLSAARNTGIAAAKGEIVAFTDSDCRADEDWLFHLVSDLQREDFAGIGGHNFLPPEDSCVAAAVLVSPGGPAHVMLNDRDAEHVPGCNMAFYKWALTEVDGFDAQFRKAGDDVDVCWRLLEAGRRIGFSPAGFVWHYRRSTVKAYLKQQAGYGQAEALLSRKHPEFFSLLGGGIWRGRIYSNAKPGLLLQRPVIYHGLFGSGFFQKLYAPAPAFALMLCTSLEFHALVLWPALLLSPRFPFLLPLAVSALALAAGICIAGAAQADLPATQRRFWSRPLVALLFFLQPIVRGWARHRARLASSHRRASVPKTPPPLPAGQWAGGVFKAGYWGKASLDRYELLRRILARLEAAGWNTRLDTGWDDFDAETSISRWVRVRLVTAGEDLGENRRFFRFRARIGWSPLAGLTIGCAVLGLVVLLLVAAPLQPWLWLGLPVIALVGMFFDGEREDQIHALAAVLDKLSEELELDPFERQPSGRRPR